jgi:hypothetical protein
VYAVSFSVQTLYIDDSEIMISLGSLLQFAKWKITIVNRDLSSISHGFHCSTTISLSSAKVQKIDALKDQAQNEQNQRKFL